MVTEVHEVGGVVFEKYLLFTLVTSLKDTFRKFSYQEEVVEESVLTLAFFHGIYQG